MRELTPALTLLALIAGAGAPSVQAQPAQGTPDAPGGAAPAASYMDAIASYLGIWRSEQKEGRSGRSFHFRYRVEWFDDARTIIQITIRQQFQDGGERLFWTGFKGWSPAEGDTYYVAFSPQRGRVDGRVFLNGEGELVTSYAGQTPEGEPVRVRDIMSPVEDGSFRAVTYLSVEGGPWQDVARDRWRRVETFE